MADDGRAAAVEVVILTQAECGLCEQAKDTLARVAEDFPLAISELDVGSPEGEQLGLSRGVIFPPGVLLDGRLFCYGRLSERKLRRELSRPRERG